MNTAQILAVLPDAIEAGKQARVDEEVGQVRLFEIELPVPDLPEPSPAERLRWEKELLGTYLSGHPLDGGVQERILAYTGKKLNELEGDDDSTFVGGIVFATTKRATKAGKPMLKVKLQDLYGTVEAVVFPQVLAQTSHLWKDGAIVLVSGRYDSEFGSVVVNSVYSWDHVERTEGAVLPKRLRHYRPEAEARAGLD